MARRRNMLPVVVDQWRADFMPVLDADFLRTPNLDRLCRQGVTFRNHVTTAVPCGPAYAILPIITLGVGGAAVLARFTRSAMLEVLSQPYIRMASAKGVPWHAVVRGHALPNAAIPTVTMC